MPLHNDLSIYGLDRNVTFRDGLFGFNGDNNKKSANYLVGDVAQLILNTFGEAYSNTLLSGGVTWISGFTYEVSDLAYILNSIFYTADSVQITLDDADVTNDRIDVIVVNANGDISVITGTPSVNPVKPQVPDGFLEISFVIVEANATQPETIIETLAYNENLGTPTEWTPSQLNTTAFNFANTTNPFRDSNSILFTNVIGETNRELSLTSATNLLTEDYGTLHFYIKLNAPLVDTDVIQIYLKNASNESTNYIRLGNGSYGFDINNTSSYQSIIIPFSAFVVKPEQFNSLNIVLADDVTSSFQIDYIRFIGGINTSQTFNTLLSLLDTPNTYTKKGGYGVIVNDAENSVTFKRVPLFEDLYSSNAIINGGIIYETGLTYTVWATAYIVNGIVYFDEPISEQVTLNPADATNARIDVFAIFNDGEGNRGATVIEGIPDPNPIKPNLTNLNQVEVSFKLLQANETAPPEVNSVAIYDENAGEPSEWTNSVIPTGANPNFATDPFTGSVSYDLGLSTSNRNIEFTSATAITYNLNGNLVIGIKSLNRWSNLDRIDLRIGNNNDRIKSNYVTILRRNASNYNLDLDSSDWQYAYIPLNAFAFQGQTFNVIEGQFYLNTQVYLDNIFVQTGNTNPITTPANTNWGDIQGSLQDQTDLIAYIQSQVSASVNLAPIKPFFTYTRTDQNITFFGLDTSGETASLEEEYLTEAELLANQVGQIQGLNYFVFNSSNWAVYRLDVDSQNLTGTLADYTKVASYKNNGKIDDQRFRAVIDIVDNTQAPPTTNSGDRYILDFTPGSVNAGYNGASKGDIVEHDGTEWMCRTPNEGVTVYVDAKDNDYRFIDDGTPAWEVVSSGGSVEVDQAISGTKTLDHNNIFFGEKTMTAATTFSDSNLVVDGFTRGMYLTGDFAPTFPAYWIADVDSEAYDGTKVCRITWDVLNATGGSEHVRYFIKAVN